MVTRPIFSPLRNEVGVRVETSVPFVWSPGFASSQKKKNVLALHAAIRESDSEKIPLEVSSKSEVDVGIRLSAFNLGTTANGKVYTVESVFQASKVFEGGVGPFPELYGENPLKVRQTIRELATRPLVAFQTGSTVWDITPTRAFYDWVYCRALHRNLGLVEKLAAYNCFTDIEFNPVRSLNCQAYAVALYLSLMANGVLDEALGGKDAFLRYHPEETVGQLKSNSVPRKRKATRRARS